MCTCWPKSSAGTRAVRKREVLVGDHISPALWTTGIIIIIFLKKVYKVVVGQRERILYPRKTLYLSLKISCKWLTPSSRRTTKSCRIEIFTNVFATTYEIICVRRCGATCAKNVHSAANSGPIHRTVSPCWMSCCARARGASRLQVNVKVQL